MTRHNVPGKKKLSDNPSIIMLLNEIIAVEQQSDRGVTKEASSDQRANSMIDRSQVDASIARSIERLRVIRSWLIEDERLLALVDAAMGNYVLQAERRASRLNIILSICTTLGGVLLGWIASTIAPPPQLWYLVWR